MYTVVRKETVIGFATHDGAVLIAPFLGLRPDHPERRFALAMLRYGNAVAAGELDEPYCDKRAELFARSLLINDDAFRAIRRERNDVLAQHFNVPVDQIQLKREDLVLYAGREPFGADGPSW